MKEKKLNNEMKIFQLTHQRLTAIWIGYLHAKAVHSILAKLLKMTVLYFFFNRVPVRGEVLLNFRICCFSISLYLSTLNTQLCIVLSC